LFGASVPRPRLPLPLPSVYLPPSSKHPCLNRSPHPSSKRRPSHQSSSSNNRLPPAPDQTPFFPFPLPPQSQQLREEFEQVGDWGGVIAYIRPGLHANAVAHGQPVTLPMAVQPDKNKPDKNRPDKGRLAISGGGGGGGVAAEVEKELVQGLLSLRREIAPGAETHVFAERGARDIAAALPMSRLQLSRVESIGRKADKWGDTVGQTKGSRFAGLLSVHAACVAALGHPPPPHARCSPSTPCPPSPPALAMALLIRPPTPTSFSLLRARPPTPLPIPPGL
jgi:hypothetical protein